MEKSRNALGIEPTSTTLRRLLEWYSSTARDLPWRHTRDPYAIWISEIMLQQTQVATVIPYWERWMTAFPDVDSLAAAPEDRVLKLWEGLGYYSRARNLQAAARRILQEHKSAFPNSLESLLSLPGIGPYTAGAIASIAFNQPAPILDGNVVRVLTRIHAQGGDPTQSAVRRRLWEYASHWVHQAHDMQNELAEVSSRACSTLNQALMELGALVCLPGHPHCRACPVAPACLAHKQGRESEFPQTRIRPRTTPRWFLTLLMQNNSNWLLHRRPASGVNGDYWEFPNWEITEAESRNPSLWLESRFPEVPAGAIREISQLRHAITRFRITQFIHSWPGHLDVPVERLLLPGELRWVSSAELEFLPLTGPHRRFIKRHLRAPE